MCGGRALAFYTQGVEDTNARRRVGDCFNLKRISYKDFPRRLRFAQELTNVFKLTSGITSITVQADLVGTKLTRCLDVIVTSIVDSNPDHYSSSVITSHKGVRVYTIHQADLVGHELAEEGYPNGRCEWCGSELGGEDGDYCYSCEDHMDEEMCTMDDDIHIVDSMRSAWLDAKQEIDARHTSFEIRTQPHAQNDYFVNCTHRDTEYAKWVCGPDVDSLVAAAGRYLKTHLTRERHPARGGVILISSDVGIGNKVTSQVMKLLHEHAEELRNDYNLIISAPSGLATNPNERHHYIDSLQITLGVD
jgi:hypothetical protein